MGRTTSFEARHRHNRDQATVTRIGIKPGLRGDVSIRYGKIIVSDRIARTRMEMIRLLSFAALLYCIHLIRKGLHEREGEAGLPRRSNFVDFIMIWILPIGIWFIQPRVQQAFKTAP